MRSIGNEISIIALCSSSCSAANMKVFQPATTPLFVQSRLYIPHDPLPAWEALMEVYDNKELVIYGLLWKQNLMRLNNFIAQVFLRPPWFVGLSPIVNQVYISESLLSKGVQLLFKTATFYLIFIWGLSPLFPRLSGRHSPSQVLLAGRGRCCEARPSCYLSPTAFMHNSNSISLQHSTALHPQEPLSVFPAIVCAFCLARVRNSTVSMLSLTLIKSDRL